MKIVDMIKTGAVASTVVTVALSGVALAAPVNTAFVDDNFYACIIENYNAQLEPETELEVTDNLTDVRLSELTKLECVNKDITDITGIEKMTGLELLDLAENDLETIDLSKNPLLNEGNVSVDSDVKVTYYEAETEDEDEEKETEETETEAETTTCEPWEMSDETVAALKAAMAQSGYNTSNFNSINVKKAAYDVNMCDGMDVSEANSLMNAMGINMGDDDLADLAKQVTAIYNGLKEGKTLDEIMGTSTFTGAFVPNTGVNSGEGLSAAVVIISLGLVAVAAGVGYAIFYVRRRQNNYNRVDFKK